MVEETKTSPEEVKAETKVEEPKAVETEATEAEVEVPEKFKTLVADIEKMSVLDLAELVKILEKKFGVSAAAPAMMVAGGAEEAEAKTDFDIEITDTGSNKIAVIKVIRSITELGLKEAKELADSAPKVVKEGIAKADAEKIKSELEAAGAKVTLK